MVGSRQRCQFLYRNNLHRDMIFPRQLPDLGDRIAGGIPLQEYLVDGTPRAYRFDQRLTTNNQMILAFFHGNDNCPCNSISLVFKMAATDIESVISPRSTIR